MIGVSLWLTLAWLLPRVEVLPVSRARRALDVLYKGALAALISALIAAGVESIVR